MAMDPRHNALVRPGNNSKLQTHPLAIEGEPYFKKTQVSKDNLKGQERKISRGFQMVA
jgi:hypothetical protein